MKKVVSNILAFALMLTLIMLSLIVGTKYSMLSVRGIMNSCERAMYYDKLQSEILEQAYYAGIPYGISIECIEDVFSKEKIKNDFNKVLVAQTKGENTVIRTEEIEDKIEANVISKYGKLDKDREESLRKYLVEVYNIYQEKIELPGHGTISKLINISTKAVIIGVPICLLTILVIVCMLIKMRRFAHHGLRYVVYSIFGAGMTLFMFALAIMGENFIERMKTAGTRMSIFMASCFKQEVYALVLFGIINLIIGFITIAIVSRIRAGYNPRD